MVKNIIFIGIAALLGISLFKKAKGQFYKAQGWDWRLTRFEVLNLTFNQLRAYVGIDLKNTSDVSATVEQVEFDVLTDDIFLGSVERPEPLTIDGNATKNFDFVININLLVAQNLFPTILKALTDKDLPLTFVGSFVVRKAGVKFNVPFTYNTTIRELYS